MHLSRIFRASTIKRRDCSRGVKIPLPVRLTLLGSGGAEMKAINEICEIGVTLKSSKGGLERWLTV